VPIYEYRCRACGHAFEKLVYGGGGPAVACPGCASGEVTRTLSIFGVKAGAGPVASTVPSGGGAGGCCGGGCGCR